MSAVRPALERPGRPVGATRPATDAGSPAEGSPWLRVESVVKRFGRTRVLDQVDLALTGKEFVCLLGPSGCGKTTLLRILCGIESPDAGRLWMGGQDITGMPPAQRRFGVVFQSYALFPNLTAEENVAYGLSAMDRRHRVARAREMLDLVGLAGHAGHHPAQLSGGQQQRVALARALAPQPRLLLLDEPLSALDAQVRASLRAEIRGIQQRLGVPALMVTHDQDEALAMADRVVLMNAGRIEQQGAPVALYTRPATGFAARFIGRINLLQATAEADGSVTVGEARLATDRPAGAPAPATGPLQVGIRPGHLRLHPFDDSAARAPEPQAWPANHLPGTVEGMTFCGAWVSLHLRVASLGASGQRLEAELPTPPDGRLPWRVGDRCRVELPAEALHRIDR